jgi:very-short-patch-repair endonuclease
VDLAIVDATLPFNHTPPRIMIVECDGHDFHEKTKDQARRDKQRDRFFQSKGYKVLRYAGSEIWADPEKCADEIIDELAKWDSWRNREK